jgi:D-threo-aldose 1-dehydrogenase
MAQDNLPTRRLGRTALSVSELGFGAAALGNLYHPISGDLARETLDAALDVGICHIDTAPYYGFGLSERRVGDALRGRSDVVLSTKVGRLLEPDASVSDDALRCGFRSPMPFRPVFDYSHDGVMRSWEASLQRLGLARIQVLYVHDIGAMTHGNQHDAMVDQLVKGGGLRALENLRAEGAIDAFGLGVNEIAVCLELMAEVRLDALLLAGRYTLLEHEALDHLLPACVQAQTSVIVGGPYNSGILATGTRGGGALNYNYAPASSKIVDRVARIERVCDSHGVSLAAAALQFPLAHQQVACVIPGMGRPGHVASAMTLYGEIIPSAFWRDLKAEGLLPDDAPTPALDQALTS